MMEQSLHAFTYLMVVLTLRQPQRSATTTALALKGYMRSTHISKFIATLSFPELHWLSPARRLLGDERG